MHAADPGGKLARNAGKAHGHGEKGGSGEDEGDHRRCAHRAHEGGKEAFAVKRPGQPGKDKREDHAQRGRFRRRGQPGVDAADDGDDEQGDRRQEFQRHKPFPPAWSFLFSGHALRMQKRPENDIAHEQHHQHQPGKDAGDEQPCDGLISGDTIDDQDNGGRNEQPQRAGSGQGADAHERMIAAFLKFRDGHAADGGRGGRGRAGNGGEYGAA